MLESLHDINRQLHSYGTSLYVVKGHPLAALERVCISWNVKTLTFQADRDVRSHFVENAVERLAQSLNLEVRGLIAKKGLGSREVGGTMCGGEG